MAINLADLASQYVSKSDIQEGIADIITFCEADWGLKLNGSSPTSPRLHPIQKLILKCFYNIPLDKKNKTIKIPDMFIERVLYEFTEVEALKYFYDNKMCNVSSIHSYDDRSELVLVIGRRGSKTTMSSIISAYEAYRLDKLGCPQAYYKHPENETIYICNIATSADRASELFRNITGFIERSDFFVPFKNKPTSTSMRIRTPHDLEIYGKKGKSSIQINALPCTSNSGRGDSNIMVILDELAYYFEADTSAKRSDEAIYEAITPSIASFRGPTGRQEGKIIAISSPAGRSGKLYELYNQSFGEAKDSMLMFNLPTWICNPANIGGKYFKAKYRRNKNAFLSEFGAQFSDRVNTWIDEPRFLYNCVDSNLTKKFYIMDKVPHYMAIDFGLKGDGTAVAIGHIEKNVSNDWWKSNAEFFNVGEAKPSEEDDILDEATKALLEEDEQNELKIELKGHNQIPDSEKISSFFKSTRSNSLDLICIDYCDWIKAGEGDFENKDALDLEEVIDWIQELSKRFAIQKGIFDQWSGIILAQALAKRNLKQFQQINFSKQLNSEVYKHFYDVMMDKKIRLFYDKEIIDEILMLKCTQSTKNIITVSAPTTRSAHDDRFDAIARLAWFANKEYSNDFQKNKSGSGSKLIFSSNRSTPSLLSRIEKRKLAVELKRGVPKGKKKFI